MSELIEISSEFIQAKISTHGAELKSLYDFDERVEYLWQGDKKFWGRSAPILFPIVGKLKNDQYYIGNKYYAMNQHGFARDMMFELVSNSKDSAHFKLEYNDQTLKKYPYKFSLDVIYKVYGPKLTVTYEVRNNDKRDMLFSIGSHPAFNVPLGEGHFEEYYVEFEESESEGAYYLEDGLINFHEFSDKTIFNGKKIKLKHDLFYNDALVFKDIHSQKVTLKNNNNSRSVSLEWQHAPYLGLWQPADAPFICIEPWYGVADSVDSSNNFFEKEGLNTLEAGKMHSFEMILTLN